MPSQISNGTAFELLQAELQNTAVLSDSFKDRILALSIKMAEEASLSSASGETLTRNALDVANETTAHWRECVEEIGKVVDLRWETKDQVVESVRRLKEDYRQLRIHHNEHCTCSQIF